MKTKRRDKDKVLRNIKTSLWITTITSIVAIIIFIIAYFIIKSEWLLLIAGLTVMAIFVFHKAARRIEYQYLLSIKKFQESQDAENEDAENDTKAKELLDDNKS